jgi:stage II sporulation protein AA (anti-sigma F factor antagonist)
MEIKVQESGQAWVVSVAGKLDAVSAGDYEKAISQLISDGKIRFVVNFAGLTYISSAGLRVLLSTAKQLKPKGGIALFANLQDNVQEVFEMTGFSSILGVHPSLEAALAAL